MPRERQGRSARFHEKVYCFEAANAAFVAGRLKTFGPPEGAGGPKGLDADDDGGRGRGTGLALGGENHRRRQLASLQAKSRVAGREPVGGANCWACLQILRITPLPDHSMSRDVLRPR